MSAYSFNAEQCCSQHSPHSPFSNAFVDLPCLKLDPQRPSTGDGSRCYATKTIRFERGLFAVPSGFVLSGLYFLFSSFPHRKSRRRTPTGFCRRTDASLKAQLCNLRVGRAAVPELAEFCLPPKLEATVTALRALPSDRLRYQQLMALATKLSPMDQGLKIPENKVPGCLSTVHVHAILEQDGTFTFHGDSDALISKGLVALLVLGLTGCTREQITKVRPEFIQASGISASLTPGRNNGFYNMFKLMTEKVSRLDSSSSTSELKQDKGTLKTASPHITIYNTMTKSKELFEPLQPGVLNMYVCGVTVYDLCHLGHARVMVFFDMVSRYFRSQGFKVNFVRNVTDIDDKIIKRSNEAGESAEALARRMEVEMQKDAESIGCLPPTFEPRVSENISEISDMVSNLVQKGFAYEGKPRQEETGRDVFFRVRSFKNYGRLSRCNLDANLAGARVEVEETKEAPEDFVLWKAAKPSEPSWPSSWGPGRPGWHIECSAMAKRYLGETIDIHGGGPDLVFPHHENEIAQSEAANGKPYAKTWMHCAAVRSTGNEKMSKSLGNFVTIRDVLQKYDGETIRFYLLSSQYRQPLLYSEENLAKANERLMKLYSSMRGATFETVGLETQAPEPVRRFFEAMASDFDTVNALAAMNDLSREMLQLQQQLESVSADERSSIVSAFNFAARNLRSMGAVLGILQRDADDVCRGGSSLDSDFEAQVESLLQQRAQARSSKQFARADEIRDELTRLGVVIEDVKGGGTSWRVSTVSQ